MTGAEYRVIREGLGLSRMKLAVELGVSVNTIARWELGSRPVTERTAREIERLRDQKRQQQQ